MKTGENKKIAFKRLAINRANRIMDNLRLLGNLSNTNNYEYSEKDVKKIFNSIEEELRLTKARFSLNINKNRRVEL